MKRALIRLACALALLTVAHATDPANAAKQKSVRWLMIGNSSSKDATRFLPHLT